MLISALLTIPFLFLHVVIRLLSLAVLLQKEEHFRRERQEMRLMRKQQEREMKERDRVYPFHCDSLENVSAMLYQF